MSRGVPLKMSVDSLSREIDEVFTPLDMPPKTDMLFRQNNDGYYDSLIREIERFRGKDITVELIRILHQEMSNLSAKMWLWILPSYLKYCLTPEAEYSQMETEFLIYALSPSPEFEKDTKSRLSLLNRRQLDCLLCFIEWCGKHSFWSGYCPKEISRAKFFLETLDK